MSFGVRGLNGGFAWHGMHLYLHDFVPPLGFPFVWRGIEKTNKICCYFLLITGFKTSTECVCVLIWFLSFGCSLILLYELNKKVPRHFVVFSNTGLWQKETNMAVASTMTCKIGLMWHHIKTLDFWKIKALCTFFVSTRDVKILACLAPNRVYMSTDMIINWLG